MIRCTAILFSATAWLVASGCSSDPSSATGGAGGTSATSSSSSSGGDTGGSSSSSTGSAGTGGGGGGTGGSGGGASCTPGSGMQDVGMASFLDKATCLTWQKATTFMGPITNRQALVHCNNLVQDGFDDWRLPTTQELRSYPGLPDNSNAYVAAPTYIPTNAISDADGCTGNSHSCNLAQYSVGNFSCAWQGPGANAYIALCVRGAAGIALDAKFAVATCCPESSMFKQVDCSPYP